MSRSLANTGLATRLVIALVVLIILTTLSAGVPAFLLARRQLETQAWAQVDATRRATESLYDAALSRVVDLTALLAERPTLRRLMADNDPAALQSYLLAFREQSDLDFIQICAESGAFVAVGAPVDLCAAVDDALDAGVVFIEERPALLARRVIRGDGGPEELGVVVAGVRLDGEFLAQLSANTGVDQSILAEEGGAIVSTLPAGPITAELVPEGWVIRAGGMPFFAAQFPLPGQGSRLYAEVAVPVATLIETERVALTILVAGSALVALAGGIIGAWFIRRLTAPLSVLTHTAEQISAGQLSATIPRFGQPPEVATLSAALERSQATMLEALVERSQARDWLIALIQSVVEGVITFDTRGRVTFMSQGAEIMTGWTRDEAIGRAINDLLPPADPREGETFLDRLPPAGEKREIETLTRAGKSLVLAATGARLAPPGSDTVQVALVLRDVTEEQALRNLRSFFLANISHEFRTPLSTLNASLELLLEEADDLSADDIRELLKPTHLSLLSLQTLIDNLLESSSIESGMFALRRRPVALDAIIGDALTIVRPLIERRRQTVAVTEPGSLAPPEVDRARLTQALVNLLSNASKYSPIGSPIDLQVEQRPGGLRLAVADRGPGISANDRDNLFRRFRRLHAEGDEQYGIGLGLYLTKRIAEAHGGTVGVDNRPGGGAVFWLELPTGQ
ncbi:putative Histidine kinase [Candidatus Promineifilum breve]|uniref:histidine kinase n=1 Tax=Candidatus Promineifilum breve TaxID=1806508 RepID=A0A160SY11_9CHLR|nr:ATP-binding protein [Candidatus Promineifilum breve]CUS01894.1 putative Histidine kinase [Candidatus Promineifilum breve]